MAEQRSGTDGAGAEGGTGAVLKRRGLIAGAAALVAGILAKQAAEPTAAADNAAVFLGHSGNTSNPNLAEHATEVRFDGASGQGVVLLAQADATYNPQAAAYPAALGGWTENASYPNAIYAYSGVNGGTGVVSLAANATGTGVLGSGGTYGVNGAAFGTGIGVNGAGVITGVQGVIGVSGATQPTFAVIGRNSLNRTDAYGVLGTSDHGVGVYGQTGAGLYGVRGDAGPAPGSAGLLGVSTNANGIAFGSVVVAPATIAGYFNGEVHVEGPFYVDPISNKHGVIAQPDGTKRVFYSMESPECWVEDFGTGTFANGKAEVALDKDFAAIIHTDDYHVFVTAHDAEHQLAVTARAGQGFSVQASASAEATARGKKSVDLGGTFSYRVVARPNVGKKVERMPTYTPPPKLDIAGIERQAKQVKEAKFAPVEAPKPVKGP